MTSAARGEMLKKLLSNAAGFKRKFPVLQTIEEESRCMGMDVVSKRISGIYKKRAVKLQAHICDLGPNPYLGQGVISVVKNFPKSIGVWSTGNIYGVPITAISSKTEDMDREVEIPR